MSIPDLHFSALDRVISMLSPERGVRRLSAKKVLHEFRYDGARKDHRRGSAPANMSPNSFDVQRDRLQLMREAEDMERNFAPAKALNRKVAMFCTPLSYHSVSGDPGLDSEVEEYLNEEVFPNCDITGRYDFFKMLEFGILGCNRGGDYGWAFQRLGYEDGMSDDDAIGLDLKIQAVEPDRIGGIYQNVVSEDYVSGLTIGKHGQVESFRVFHRSMTTNYYDSPIEIPASQFVHFTDPMRIDQYRGVSTLATAIQNLRDLYEMMDFVKGKAKLASALTVFTNSNGAMTGGGAMDGYSSNLFDGNSTGLQQDIQFGQINHLAAGTDIKFPASNSPSSEEQALMTLMLKMVAMSYNLPYSFALDASALGGVSSRLESELAKAEFERVQKSLAPHASRMKNAFLYDAIAKGIFPAKVYQKITKGRWGYRSHPQPDIGREASASVNLWQNGLLNPLKYWVDDAQDPENVAADMARWAKIKKDAADAVGLPVSEIFGNGPAMPTSSSESTTETTAVEPDSKELSRKDFKQSKPETNDKNDAKRSPEYKANEASISDLTDQIEATRSDVVAGTDVDSNRIKIDKLRVQVSDLYSNRSQIIEDYLRSRATSKEERDAITPEAKEIKAAKRDDRHSLVMALIGHGYPDEQAYAISYDIVESGKFNPSKLPAAIRDKYSYSQKEFRSNAPFTESDHPRADNGQFGSAGGGRSQRANVGALHPAVRSGTGKDSRITVNGNDAPDFIKAGMIPPAYSHNIRVASDRNSDVWAISEDEKGNSKRVYNPEFEKRNAAIKWARTNEGVSKVGDIRSQIHTDRNQGKNKEEADASWLMSSQATRPGSEEDTKGTKALWSKPVTNKDFTLTPQTKGPPKVTIKVGDSNIPIRDEGARMEIENRISHGSPMGDAGYWLKSHGATTLEGRHIVKNPDGSASLQFMGKEGVWHNHKVSDPNLSAMLLDRKSSAGDSGKLFNTDYQKVSKYVGGLGGGGFSPKDMRTIRANEIASSMIGSSPVTVSSDNDRKAMIKDIAIKVSSVLGNRPQQALESYINPMIFDAIKIKQSA